MQAIDHSTYEALRKGAHVLEADGSGDKVLRLADGRMLKLFRRKRLLSSALFSPTPSALPTTPAPWNCVASRARPLSRCIAFPAFNATACTTTLSKA